MHDSPLQDGVCMAIAKGAHCIISIEANTRNLALSEWKKDVITAYSWKLRDCFPIRNCNTAEKYKNIRVIIFLDVSI